jgi:adenylate kinase family enzyme
LRAALCGPNPQHVIVYGPPGVGKTAAARLVLEEAKIIQIPLFRKTPNSWRWTEPLLGLMKGGLPIP